MKLREIKGMSPLELRSRELELRLELLTLRTQKKFGHVGNPLRLRQARRELARVLSVVSGARNE